MAVTTSQRLIDPDEDHSWLDKRTPTRLDAEEAHRPLDAAFVQSFKHALLTAIDHEGDVVEYLNDDTELLLDTSSFEVGTTRNMRLCALLTRSYLSYPLSLIYSLPPLPSNLALQPLVDAFQDKARPALAFVSEIPSHAYTHANLPNYLIYSLASIGSLACSQDVMQAEQLWSAANTSIATMLEIDNREARNPDLINAVSPRYVRFFSKRGPDQLA